MPKNAQKLAPIFGVKQAGLNHQPKLGDS